MWLARALLILLCMPTLGFAKGLTRREGEKEGHAAATINVDGAIETELKATNTHQNTDKDEAGDEHGVAHIAMAQAWELGLEKLTEKNLVNFAKMMGGTGVVDEHPNKKRLLDAVHQGLTKAFLEEEEEDACEDCSTKDLAGKWCSAVPDDKETADDCPKYYQYMGGSAGTVCKYGTKKGKTRCIADTTKRCCAPTCEDCSSKVEAGRWCSAVPDDKETPEDCPNYYQTEGGSAGTVCKYGTKNGITRCITDTTKRCC